MNYPKIVHVGDTAYQVKREFHGEWFKKGLDHHGAKRVQEGFSCDRILRGRDGKFLLVDIIKEAEIIEDDIEVDMEDIGVTETEQSSEEE